MTMINTPANTQVNQNQWVRIGMVTALASIITVLMVQAAAIAIWPDIALFKPLDSYVRTALFTLVPVVGATGLFAWLTRRKTNPMADFLKISAVVLILSIIPDYLLPVEHKTFLASSVTAFLHVVAAVVTVSTLMTGYQRQTHA